jgi:Arc/MetJ-type ribon-helix-helix transcriptional regulator
MKVSVSLPQSTLAFLDSWAEAQGLSRSAAVTKAVEGMRFEDLSDEYEQAWEEWSASGEADAWDAVSSDGIG